MEERGTIGTMIEVAASNVLQTDKPTNIRKLSPAGVSDHWLIKLRLFEKKWKSYFFFVITKEVRIFIDITISHLIEFLNEFGLCVTHPY